MNPAGQIGGQPVPPGQPFTYTVRAQGRLVTADQFGDIILRANPDGSMVRLKDVARIELGAQTYNLTGRYNGKPSAILAIYQLPGTNAVDAANAVRARMAELQHTFPPDLTSQVSLDTTKAVTAGMKEIEYTLFEALGLVVLVVYIFLQGWRATLIPLLAVPVSLIGTFVVFPVLGFSINTLSLFGLVLAIGLVVDDAIVVVEAVERHIDEGLAPRDAALKAMEEVSAAGCCDCLDSSCGLHSDGLPSRALPGASISNSQLPLPSRCCFRHSTRCHCPALAALLLKPRKKRRRPLGASSAGLIESSDA